MAADWVAVVPNLREVWHVLTKPKGCGTVYLCRCGSCMAVTTSANAPEPRLAPMTHPGTEVTAEHAARRDAILRELTGGNVGERALACCGASPLVPHLPTCPVGDKEVSDDR